MAQTISSNIQFREATRQQAKACIVIDGLAGSGKTGLALLLAYVLAGEDWTKVYGTDTENRSMDLYRDINASIGVPFGAFRKFDLTSVHGFSPSNYNAVKESAKKNGAKAIVQDSITHMWQGPGGVLTMVSDAKAKDPKGDGYKVWGLPDIKKEKDAIVDCIRDSEVHIISTVRVKERFEYEDVGGGKNKLVSQGEQQIQMPDLKYEPDLVLSMESPGNTVGKTPTARVVKSRYAILDKDNVYEFTMPLLVQLRDYLAEGADPEKLKEQQRLELITLVSELVSSNVSKQTMLPFIKEQIGEKDKDIADMPLQKLRTLYTILTQ